MRLLVRLIIAVTRKGTTEDRDGTRSMTCGVEEAVIEEPDGEEAVLMKNEKSCEIKLRGLNCQRGKI